MPRIGGGENEGALGVDRVVEDDRVDDQAERAELFFLASAVGLAELAAAAVADLTGEGVAPFARRALCLAQASSAWSPASLLAGSTATAGR